MSTVINKNTLPVIKYATFDISKCEVQISYVRDSKLGRSRKVKTIVDNKNGIVIQPSDRFWASLFREYKLGPLAEQFFKYFTYEEVFNRIKSVCDSPLSAICLQYVPGTSNRFVGYGISRLAQQAHFDDVVGVLEKKSNDLKKFEYRDGVIRSTHYSKDQISNFVIGDDKYSGYVTVETPIDGVGMPQAFIGIEREVCTNGLTAMTSVFRSQFKVSGNGIRTLETILDGYRNEDGFIQLKKRFENADLSYISLREALKVSNLFSRLTEGENVDNKIHTAVWKFSDMLGDFPSELGIASLGQVSDKVAGSIPMRPSLLSVIQLLTECSSHYLAGGQSDMVHKFLGSMIASNYDLELSKTHMGDYDAFLLQR